MESSHAIHHGCSQFVMQALQQAAEESMLARVEGSSPVPEKPSSPSSSPPRSPRSAPSRPSQERPTRPKVHPSQATTHVNPSYTLCSRPQRLAGQVTSRTIPLLRFSRRRFVLLRLQLLPPLLLLQQPVPLHPSPSPSRLLRLTCRPHPPFLQQSRRVMSLCLLLPPPFPPLLMLLPLSQMLLLKLPLRLLVLHHRLLHHRSPNPPRTNTNTWKSHTSSPPRYPPYSIPFSVLACLSTSHVFRLAQLLYTASNLWRW